MHQLLEYSRIRFIISSVILSYALICILSLVSLTIEYISNNDEPSNEQLMSNSQQFYPIILMLGLKISICLFIFFGFLRGFDDIKRFYYSLRNNYQQIRNLSEVKHEEKKRLLRSKKSFMHKNSLESQNTSETNQKSNLLSVDSKPLFFKTNLNKKSPEVFSITDFAKFPTHTRQFQRSLRKNTSFDLSQYDQISSNKSSSSKKIKQIGMKMFEEKVDLAQKYREQFKNQLAIYQIDYQQTQFEMNQTKTFLGELIRAQLKNSEINQEKICKKIQAFFDIQIVGSEEQRKMKFASNKMLRQLKNMKKGNNKNSQPNKVQESFSTLLVSSPNDSLKGKVTLEDIIQYHNKSLLSHIFCLKTADRQKSADRSVKNRQFFNDLSQLIDRQIEIDKGFNFGKLFSCTSERKQMQNRFQHYSYQLRNNHNIYDPDRQAANLDVNQNNQYLIRFFTDYLNTYLPQPNKFYILTNHQSIDQIPSGKKDIYQLIIPEQSLFPHYNLKFYHRDESKIYKTIPGTENIICAFWLYLKFIRKDQRKDIQTLSLEQLFSQMHQ